MRHLRRNSRANDRVGTGKRTLDHATTPATGEEALVGAPRPWKPQPIRPNLQNLPINSPLGREIRSKFQS